MGVRELVSERAHGGERKKERMTDSAVAIGAHPALHLSLSFFHSVSLGSFLVPVSTASHGLIVRRGEARPGESGGGLR